MTVGSLALAAGMAYLLLVKPPVPEGPGPLVAALSPYGSPGATFLVRVGANGAATVVAVGDTNVPQGRSLELWAVNGTAAPVSMGLLPDSGRKPLTIEAVAGTQLLVSQEPAGGSPSKAPTGPVVYAGKLTGI
jgi:anti-sigma-K factor RskA